MMKVRIGGLLLLLFALLVACSDEAPTSGGITQNDPNVFSIVAGSEQVAIMDQIVIPWCKTQGYNCQYNTKGSVDQAVLLQSGNVPYDAMWFASTVFWQLGDSKGLLQHVKPMFSSPIVFAGWKSEMQKLGFVGRDVKVADILDVAENGKARVWMTNPSQSNSGASAYLAFLNYFAGNGPGQALTLAQLQSQQVQDEITKFVRAIDHTSPSSGDLMRSCAATPDQCQTLFTYEALVIEQNQQQVKDGKETLYAVYPSDGLSIADSPLGYMPHNDAKKEQIFLKLQEYLLADEGVAKIRGLGRRAGAIGLQIPNPDKTVFNPDWGIDPTRVIQPIAFPDAQVIEDALSRYQTAFRQPVHAVYCLDGSGSMGEAGWPDLVKGSETVFDQSKAAQYFLQAHPEDLTSVMIFNSDVVGGPWTVQGADAASLRAIYDDISKYTPDGGTNMYACLKQGLQLFADNKGETRKRLIIMMTDGKSETDDRDSFKTAYSSSGGIPIVSIAYGDADKSQLTELAQLSGGTVVDQGDLITALRQATGYK